MFILAQTLQFIYYVKSAIAHSHRILRPGGVPLATIPAVSRLAGEGIYSRNIPKLLIETVELALRSDQVPTEVVIVDQSIDPHSDLFELKPERACEILFTGNMGAYRSVFDEIGTFDERLGPGTEFPAAEDNDIGFRLLKSGYRICYAPEAILYH